MRNLYRFTLLPFLLLLANHSFAQRDNEPFINGDFTGINFQKFAEALQQQTGYVFYFDKESLDSVNVNVSLHERKIRSVLDEVFKSTSYHYAIDGQKHIYIVKDRVIQDALPDDFFDRGDNRKDDTSNKALLDYLDNEKKQKSKALAENRLYEIGKKTNSITPGNATIGGHVKTLESGEPVIGASVYMESPTIGVTTDQFGYFAITIPKGRHELIIKSIGMKNTKRQIMLYSDGKLDIELQEDVTALKEVIVEGEKDKNVSGMQMGLEKLDIKTMKKVPVAFGEVDILRVVLTLPGVQSVGEGSTGLNVRGGATNQNLILFNDATVYNPSHLFGFFSAFNPDVVKNVELYKSGIPAQFGGRLSSVLDVNSREGNKKKFAGSGGIGPITSRLTLEGPIIKDKTSFLIGARSTYSDWLLKKIPSDALAHSQASFYDVNASVNHEINDKNSIYLTGYISKDRFSLNSDTIYNYSNKNAVLKWKHIFGNKLYGVATAGYSGYDYKVTSEQNPTNAYNLTYAINQTNGKIDFSYFPVPKHSITFGVNAIKYSLSPGSFLPRGEKSIVTPDVLSKEQGIESALYIGDQFEISRSLSLYYGIRYSSFNYLGARDVYKYAPDIPKTVNTIQDTISYKAGKSIVNYGGPEYRFSAKYAISNNASVKLSYNRTRQYIQMLSNTTAISPTDIWKLSDTNIKPQIGDQIALGFYKNFRANTIETSVETYYKTMQNSLDYKGGATLILNHHIETDIVNAKGKAYGVEVMVKKMSGKVNGWVSYTYSRSLLQTNSAYASETINHGKYYPSNYDKPHAINLIGNYKFSHRFSVSLNGTYSTGRPITIPIAKYEVDGPLRLYYSERNQYRIPNYFRVDFAMNIEGNHRIRKLAHSSWTLGIYNLTGRRNAYSVFFTSENGSIVGKKLSIFGAPIPTVTYNFRF